MTETLLDLVNQLSRPRTVHHKQYDQDGKYLRTATVTHEALLVQLGDAVAASTGNDGGSKSGSARERNMVDSEAMYLFGVMSSVIADWCVQMGVTPQRGKPASNLQKWYVAYNAYTRPDVAWRQSKMGAWVQQIVDKLDPPYRLVVDDPCPICGAQEFIDPNGVKMPHPVLVETREGTTMVGAARAVCRACQKVWDGEMEVRFLRFTLDYGGENVG